MTWSGIGRIVGWKELRLLVGLLGQRAAVLGVEVIAQGHPSWTREPVVELALRSMHSVSVTPASWQIG